MYLCVYREPPCVGVQCKLSVYVFISVYFNLWCELICCECFHISASIKLHLYARPRVCRHRVCARVYLCVWWTVSNGFVWLLELKKLILIGCEARTNTCIFILRFMNKCYRPPQINTHFISRWTIAKSAEKRRRAPCTVRIKTVRPYVYIRGI